MGLGLFFIPESPRYLLLNGQTEAALAISLSQRNIQGEGEDVARAEFLQMKAQTEMDSKLDNSWLSFIKKPEYRRRLAIILITIVITQSTGNIPIINYVCAVRLSSWIRS